MRNGRQAILDREVTPCRQGGESPSKRLRLDEILQPAFAETIAGDFPMMGRIWLACHGLTGRQACEELEIVDKAHFSKLGGPNQRPGAVRKIAEAVGFDAEACLAAGRNAARELRGAERPTEI